MNINQFRCWDKIEKKYVDAFAIDCDGDLLLWDWNDSGDKGFIYAGNNWQDRYSVQRFTGICDSESVKICEGDLIINSDMDKSKEVKFERGAFGIYLDEFSFEPLLNIDECDNVIIGNIYQNPELLTTK